MMRHIIFFAVLGASFAANNVLQCTSGCNWYGDALDWSLGRFPRTGDSSVVNADTKFADNAPAYMAGASQGAELRQAVLLRPPPQHARHVRVLLFEHWAEAHLAPRSAPRL